MNYNLELAQDQSTSKKRLKAVPVLFGASSLLCILIGLIFKVENLKGIGSLLGMAYLLALIWWLARGRPTAEERSSFLPLINISSSFWIMMGLTSICAVAAFILAGVVMGNAWLMFPWSTPLAILILVVLRQKISRRVILSGSILFVAFLVIELIFQPGNIWKALFNALIVAFQAAAGVVLLKHTGLSKIQFFDGHLLKALKSLGVGCVLAIPPALFNIASLTSDRLTMFDRQFDQWWKAFYALQPGILEETWARLFLLTFFYAVLHPTSQQKPARAITAALFISVFIHGVAHYPQSLLSPVTAAVTALMYGIPLGLIFIKRDFETTVGYHFLVDFVRFAFTAILINA